MSKPNLLFIMTDQQRWDAMNCSGGWVDTPNLDRIAAEGVRFSHCVTTTPICIPARVTLATGRYPHATGVWHNANYTLPGQADTWMQAVRDAGYRTSLFGKTHLHPHRGDLRECEPLMHAYGLDDVDEIGGPRASAVVMSHMTARWESLGLLDGYRDDYRERFANKPYVVRPAALPLEEYADIYVGQRAREYLERYEHEAPWCCWVSFGGPHEPWDAPEPWASRYDPESMPDPVPRPTDERPRPRGVLDAKPVVDFEPGEAKRMRANYAGNVSLIDDQIGTILDTIAARGELDNTAIVFSSDHGEMNGDYGTIYKSNFLDGAVRVPLIVRTPDTLNSDVAGKVNSSPAELLDVGPTLVALAGAELTHQQHGQSLLPAVAEPNSVHRVNAISAYEGELMLLNDTHKLAVNSDGETYLLFDRAADPQEINNLAADPEYRDVAMEMKASLLERVLTSQVRVAENMPPLPGAQAPGF